MSAQLKLVVYVPTENADEVRRVIGENGGGKIGNYSFCSFSSKGVGRFKPETGANPHIGNVGEFEAVEEERIEVIIPTEKAKEIVAAMKSVHPYEEVVYDLYPLEVIG
jgi:hypothetical protein